MKRNGWYGDSWRHSLSAKGISSTSHRYFQQAKTRPADFVVEPGVNPNKNELEGDVKDAVKDQKKDPLSPVTILARERAQEALDRRLSEKAKAQQPGQQLLAQVQQGDFSGLENFKDTSYSESDKRAIIAEVNKQAVELTEGGQKVPPNAQKLLTTTTKNQLNALRKQQLVEGRGVIRTLSAESFKGTVAGVEEGLRIGGEGFAENSADVRLRRARENAKIDEAKRLEGGDFPFVDISDNVFLGDGVGGIGSDADNGAFDFLSDPADETSPLSSAIVPNEKFKGPDFGAGGATQKSFSEKLSDQVEDLWSSRRALGEIDKAPLRKGEKAFRMGDREKLVEAINDQEFQIKQQESRWRLVDQTRQIVETSKNRQDLFESKPSSPFSMSMFGSKGQQIADETRKINEVKKMVKQGADEARARSTHLRGNLQRMDAITPPVTSLPDEDVRVFKKEFSFADLLKQRGTADEQTY